MPKLSRSRKSAAAFSQDVQLRAKTVCARLTQLVQRRILSRRGIQVQHKSLRQSPKLLLENPEFLDCIEQLLPELEDISRFQVDPALLNTPAKQRQLLQGKFVKVTDGHKTRLQRPLAPSASSPKCSGPRRLSCFLSTLVRAAQLQLSLRAMRTRTAARQIE